MATKNQGKKVFVAMSGGVDSSVAAALLKKQGYEVTGVFIKIDGLVPSEVGGCNWREERRDAMRATAKLGIPFITLDLSQAYQKSVVDYLINEYRIGRTPNPDVMCNKRIKFGEFFTEARRRGADLIATGHYAQKQLIASSFQLLTSKDREKDQTYFLWTIKQEILAKCLFPIGDYQKSEVRAIAKRFGLSNAAKPDSQGLCFLGQIDFKDFLVEQLPKKSGLVLNEKGEVIGEHRGAHLYTIGERHGFRIKHKTSSETPYYIVAKNIKQNTLTVVSRARFDSWAVKEIILTDTNWFTKAPNNGQCHLQARTRYRAPLVFCRVFAEAEDNRAKVIFTKPQSSLAPGQSCVIYNKNICFGGGVIT